MASNAELQELQRLNELYERDMGHGFDLEEFGRNDFYASQILQGALGAADPELRRMAAHVEAWRSAALESFTIRPLEPLDVTWRLRTLDGAHPPAAASSGAGTAVPRAHEPVLPAPDLARFRDHYLRVLGCSFDADRFGRDALYRHAVLADALASTDPDLERQARLLAALPARAWARGKPA